MLKKDNYETSKDFNVRLNEPYREVDANSKIYRRSNDYVVSFKFVKSDEFVIQVFDPKDMHEVIRAENEFNERNAQFKSFINLDGKFYCLYSLYDKSNKVQDYYTLEIDPGTAKFKGEGKKLLSVDGMVSGAGMRGFREVDKFGTVLSKDSTNLMVFFKMKPESRNEKISFDQIGLNVFDASLNKLHGASF